MMFGRRKKEKERSYKRRPADIYAVASAGRGLGATHLAVSIQSFLSSVKMIRSALVELSGHGAVKGLLTLAGDEGQNAIISGPVCGFSYLGADYFPDAKKSDLAFIKALDYEAIILDLGLITGNTALETARDIAGKRLFITGSVSPFRYQEFRELMRTIINERPWLLESGISSFCAASPDIDRFRKEFSIRLRRIPYIRDPFCISNEDIDAISAFLGENKSPV